MENLTSLLADLAAEGDRLAVITMTAEDQRTLTCAALARQAASLAWGLREAGIGPGVTAAIIGPNDENWVIARLALGCTGALVFALDDLAGEAELASALSEIKCQAAVTSPAHAAALKSADPHCRLVVMDDAAPDGAISWRSLFRERTDLPPPADPAAPSMLLNTSGSTGKPKAFALTDAQVWANIDALVRSGMLLKDDRVLLPLPLHHIYAFKIGILTVLSCRSIVVFPVEVTGPQILRTLSDARITALIGVPRLLSALRDGVVARLGAAAPLPRFLFRSLLDLCIWSRRRFDFDLGRTLMAPVRKRLGPHLRILSSGGALLQPDVLWTLVGLGFEVRTGYGLAENGSLFTGNLPVHTRLGSEGKALIGDIRIVPVEASADLGGDGEIQLRGPTVFGGYLNNEEANRDSFTADGWFRTGDLGHLDPDGFLYVTGRIKELLVLGGGKKVLPEDLEKKYASPYIKEMAVLERDGALVALVLPDLEAIRASGSPRVEDLIRVALSESAMALPSYKRVTGYRIIREPLPKTRLQKFQRFKLRAIYDAAGSERPKPSTAAPAAGDQELLRSEPARTVFALLKSRYPGKPVSLDANPLLDLGIDSLEWIGLALALEQQAGVHLDQAQAGESLTVRDLLRGLAAAPQPASASSQQAIDLWLKPAGGGARAIIALLSPINTFLVRSLFRLTVKGRENVPATGPFVLTPNHESDLDAMMVAAALTSHTLYWGGDAGRLFSKRWLHGLLRAAHIFPVNERRPRQTLAMAAEVLRRGECLVWFPESWRSPDGRLQKFLPGIGQLLAQAQVPAIPTYIEGTFEVMPRQRRVPRLHHVTVTFGPPVLPQDLPPGPPQTLADALHDRVAAMEAESIKEGAKAGF